MAKLILQPTTLAQWHALVSEAEVMAQVDLIEDVESYLVFLLMRYTEKTGIAKSVLGLDFLEAINEVGRESDANLQDVGDKCLLLSGLFPGICERRRVALSYYIDLGQCAYTCLSTRQNQKLLYLFNTLSREFEPMMTVLRAMDNL